LQDGPEGKSSKITMIVGKLSVSYAGRVVWCLFLAPCVYTRGAIRNTESSSCRGRNPPFIVIITPHLFGCIDGRAEVSFGVVRKHTKNK